MNENEQNIYYNQNSNINSTNMTANTNNENTNSTIPAGLQKALDYLNRHQFDPVVSEEMDDENDFELDSDSNDNIEEISSSTIIEDNSSNENFDDIGLF